MEAARRSQVTFEYSMASALGAQIDLHVGSGMRIIIGAMTSAVSAGESFES